MQITHNVVTAGLWLVVSASGIVIGRLIRWRRHLRELDDAYDDGYDRGWDDAYAKVIEEDRQRARAGDDLFDAMVSTSRRTVVLEPGPTIYPALAALAQDALDGPESHAEPIDSTWLYKILLDWENRYPIPLNSPNGRMAEAI